MTVSVEDVRAAAKATNSTLSDAVEELSRQASIALALHSATAKLQAARDTYATVVIDHLNPALAVSLGLTIGEIDVLLTKARKS